MKTEYKELGGTQVKKLKLAKVIVGSLVVASVIALNPTAASAEWKQNNTGWWYTEGNSYATGWKLIDKNWYYFYSDGYMAHDTTIDGYYLNSLGAWTDSTNTLIGREILKNVSVENPSAYIELSSSDIDVNNIENVIHDEMSKLRITNSYEMFNVTKYSGTITGHSSGNIDIKIDFTYRMTAGMEADLDTKVRAIVADIAPDSMSQYEKERAIHDWIINNTKYDQSYTIYDPYNTLIQHTGVCEGYTLLAQKMFTVAGIKSIVVEGTADGQDHAWNMVYIDNKWRHVDCTWDDPISSEDVLRYDYYNLTDNEISEDHYWNTSAYPSAK